MKNNFLKGLLVCSLSMILISYSGETKADENIDNSIKITSTAFENEGIIPSKYTCDNENISPPLKIENIPIETKSITLIHEDPDSSRGTWVHWLLFNIKPDTKELLEKIPTDKVLENGTIQGITNYGESGYKGPCPTIGMHRYYFKFYALDKMLDLDSNAKKEDILKAMEGHILAKGELMGKYQRQNNKKLNK